MAEFRKEMALKDIMEKTGTRELAWFKRNYLKIYKDPDRPAELIPKSAEILYNEMIKWQQEMVEAEANRVKDVSPPKGRRLPSLVIAKSEIERPPMYPIEERILKILYDGISHNDEGRRLYLRVRNHKAPYDKYYDPLAYGMDYGWKVEERGLRPNKEFASAQVINDQFYRRFGVKGETLRNRHPMPGSHIMVETL